MCVTEHIQKDLSPEHILQMRAWRFVQDILMVSPPSITGLQGMTMTMRRLMLNKDQLSFVGKPLGKPGHYVLRGLAKFQAHRYVLFNCSDVNPFLPAHADEISSERDVSSNTVESIQHDKFNEWFKAHIIKLEKENGSGTINNDIRWLARGPVDAAKRYRAYNSRGYWFRPIRLNRVSQNSGVVVRAKTSTYVAPGDATYYGKIIDIIQLNYSGQFFVDLFKCEWVDVSEKWN